MPAEVCDNCGECYLSDDVTGELLERAEEAIASGAEVEIRRYATCPLKQEKLTVRDIQLG